jgi:hypothetical protein
VRRRALMGGLLLPLLATSACGEGEQAKVAATAVPAEDRVEWLPLDPPSAKVRMGIDMYRQMLCKGLSDTYDDAASGIMTSDEIRQHLKEAYEEFKSREGVPGWRPRPTLVESSKAALAAFTEGSELEGAHAFRELVHECYQVGYLAD